MKKTIALTTLLMTSQLMAARGVTKDEIVVGSHTSLSGPAAIWGVASMNGIRLRFDEANRAGGIHKRQLKLKVEDHQYQVPRAIQAANKLINRDGVFMMLAALGTPMNNAVMKKQFSKKVPNLFPYSSARSMYEPFHPLKVGAFTSYYHQVRKGLNHFIKEKGYKSICVAYQDTDFGQEIKDAVADEVAEHKLSIKAETTHKPTEISFDVAVGKLKQANCQLVVMGTIVKDTIQIKAAALKAGWKTDFLATLASYDHIVAGVKGGITNGLYAASPFVAVEKDSKLKGARNFFASYKKTYGKDPGVAAQMGYIYAEISVKAFEKAGPNLTVEGFMKQVQSFDSIKVSIQEDPIRVNPKRDFSKDPSYLSQVVNGKWTKVKTIN